MCLKLILMIGCALCNVAAEPIGEGDVGVSTSLTPDFSTNRSSNSVSPWYFIVGLSNVWPRLEESEHEINRDINGRLGSLFPRWNRPETFADWRDEVRLWDLQAGFGRDLGSKWSAFSVAGGIMGTARTRNGYFPLGFPIHIYTKFHRKVWFLATGIDYYPWGKAEFPKPSAETNCITRRLYAARPFLEAATGYVNVYTVGQVKIELPWSKDLAKIKHAEYYDLFYVSPRVGLDVPLSERDTLALMAGYLFFTRHPDEFSGFAFYFTFKHHFTSRGKKE